MSRQDTCHLKVPLGRTAHELAIQYGAQQLSVVQGRQVYLNTLAIYAVQSWLQWMHIDTDWPASISWQASLQGLMGVADLWIPNRGRLMCQAVLSGAPVVSIPATGTDGLGCVVVQFADRLDQAVILGFTAALQTDEGLELPLSQLRPLPQLLDLLHREDTPIVSAVNDLQGWLVGVCDQGWQSLEALLDRPETEWAWAYRSRASSVLRVKRIDGQGQLTGQSVLLLVSIAGNQETPVSSDTLSDMIEVQVQLHPEMEQSYLPPGMQLALFSEDLTCLQQTTARVQDNFIQLLPFRCSPGERFSLQVTLEDVWATETFRG